MCTIPCSWSSRVGGEDANRSTDTLKWQQRQQSRSFDGEWRDITETLPAPEPDAQVEELRELIHTDPTGELKTTHIRGKPHVTAQLLLQRRGLEDEDWKILEADLQTRTSTLSGFYQDKCLPLIRRLWQENGEANSSG